MARIERYSTRLKGFHLRNYRTGPGDESESFSANIFLHDQEIGTARNDGNGGPDMIWIRPEHRDAWRQLARYMDEHPFAVREDGLSFGSPSGEESAVLVLRSLHEGERKLWRSRKYRSGIICFTWEAPFPGSTMWWANANVLLADLATIPPEDVDPRVFRILTLGTNNERFAREHAPPPGQPL